MFELLMDRAVSAEVHDLDSVLGDDLSDEIWLVNHKSGSEFHNTLLHCCDALLEVHIVSEFIVKH